MEWAGSVVALGLDVCAGVLAPVWAARCLLNAFGVGGVPTQPSNRLWPRPSSAYIIPNVRLS